MDLWTEELLNERLTTPSPALIEDIKQIKGDILVIGAAGKMGPSLCVLAKKAAEAAGVAKQVTAVSRFSDQETVQYLSKNGIRMIQCDLLKDGAVDALPDVENIIYMAGKKFGTADNECMTWAMNATLPALAARKFKKSRIVAFSTGNVYPPVPLHTAGITEECPVNPVGEYAMSCLARERAFEYAASQYGTKVFIFRLNYAVDLRYGLLYDLANLIMQNKPIPLASPCVNCIWQGSANEMAIRALLHAASPANKMNITGPELYSVRKTAGLLGKYLGREPAFSGEEGNDAFIIDSSRAMETFGYPAVSSARLIRWQAEWLLAGGRTLDKPTHFEERQGKF
ncbi:MAG: NAD(P)-dependent oxidoreductase [Clostridiaceae bacterium]|nr:NAD(P)-dependent oxidoreductase [Clostridiaceae bacterium]